MDKLLTMNKKELTRNVVIQVKPSLRDTDREQFLSVFLHECAHARFHSSAITPSNWKVLPPVRSSNFRGLLLNIKDSVEELIVEAQVLGWLQYAGKGPMRERLFRLQKWRKNR